MSKRSMKNKLSFKQKVHLGQIKNLLKNGHNVSTVSAKALEAIQAVPEALSALDKQFPGQLAEQLTAAPPRKRKSTVSE